MKSIFERVKIQQKLHLPFVIYRKPNSKTLIGIFQKDDHLYFSEDFTEKGFVFAPFSGAAVCFPFEKSEVKFNTIYFKNNTEVTHHVETLLDEKDKFESLVEKGVEVIKTGICNKIVLSRKEIVAIEDFDMETTFEKMLHTYLSAFCYCWFHPKIGLWMGASPEQLFKAKEFKFHTMALAGTQLYTGDETVLWKNKERKEQEFVTEFILDKLKKESQEVKISEPYTTRAGNLLHLRTDIDGVLNQDANLKNVIDILHPTPAVCGLPKDLAKAFIEQNEGYDREFYTGFLGEINLDYTTNEIATDLYVNLRCMKVEEKKANLFIGCGITKDSKPAHEWEETVNKAKTMKHIL
ncbi:MAG: isochorismate synthase [Flavobacterium sp.]|nr:isochorismate synthase [Flavobacterium sp.]